MKTLDHMAHYQVIESVPGGRSSPGSAFIDSNSRDLYIAQASGIAKFDLLTSLTTTDFIKGADVNDVAFRPRAKVLSLNRFSANAFISDEMTGTLLAVIAIGKSPISVLSGLAYVIHSGSEDVTVIDPRESSSIGSISVGGHPGGAVADQHGKIFVTVEDRGKIAIIDAVSLRVFGSLGIKNCKNPSNLAIDAGDGVLITSCDHLRVLATSIATGMSVATFQSAK